MMNDIETPHYTTKRHASPISPLSTDAANTTPRPIDNTQSPSVKKRNRNLLFVLIAIAVALITLGIVYFYWYQNPTKVVSDAMTNAINAKSLDYSGSLKTTGSTAMNVAIGGDISPAGGTVDAHFTFDARGKKYTLGGNGLVNESGDLFFKVKEIDDLANNYRSAIPPSAQSLFDKIIAKINDKWIKISADDLKSYSPQLAVNQKCAMNAVKKIQSDQSAKSELLTIYKKHPFILIDKTLPPKAGNTGYALKIDQSASKAFTKEYKETSFYKTLQKCDETFTVKGDNLFTQDAVKKTSGNNLAIWVDRWSHRITNVTLEDKTNAASVTTVDLNTKFNQPATITTPKDTTTLTQLQKDVQELLLSTQGR